MPESSLVAEISKRTGIEVRRVAAVVGLLAEGATVPFIARYRKEHTGALDEVQVENIRVCGQKIREFDERKEFITQTIEALGKMTDELRSAIAECSDERLLEDIYMPYKPTRRTRASVARSLGLEPLARIVMAQRVENPEVSAARFVKTGVDSADKALAGACDIIAEWVNESAKARALVRRMYGSSAVITAKLVKGKESDGGNFRDYFDFREPLKRCSSHRYLAMRRGENEGVLKVSLSIDDDEAITRLCGIFVRRDAPGAVALLVSGAVRDAYKRLLRPSIENEVAAGAKQRADEAAIAVFADGLRQILMAPPMPGQRILGVDPGFRTGCKLVCLDELGNLLAHDVIYPNAPRCDKAGAARVLIDLQRRYCFDTVAIGNGTASRETRDFMSGVEFPNAVDIQMVSEQGASIYSASEVAREEFPSEDITVRGAVSIGRRLLDPLAELVKIDPKSIGVGQYQHDVNSAMLVQSLDFTVDSCVNSVGVNVNTASVQLLSRVSGINRTVAENIVRYRSANGAFGSRSEIMRVPRMGQKSYQQCSGFLRVNGSVNPLDNTRIHPECYHVVESMARDLNVSVGELVGNAELISRIDIRKYQDNGIGEFTIDDILSELKKPWLDPRATPEEVCFDERIRDFSDITVGMELTGRVCNVTAFGAFVDIGIKESGLVHISQLSDRFVRSASEVVGIGDKVRVKVLDVDSERRRISLTMKLS